ncbi:MAG: UDP-glucose/GDP-mannose dehydrogenase family protein [Bacillota bacterium]|nr:UDP-glucose/GDP-mannose dehydrogenase family protein [Bacillota bacterium]
MKVGIIGGSGYVGLVTGAGLARKGHEVVCMDIEAEKIRLLQRGHSPIHEQGLTELIREGLRAERLFFTTELAEAVRDREVVFIAVGTPAAEDGNADLNAVLTAARELAPHLRGYTVVALKSTVPPGSSHLVKQVISRHLGPAGAEFDVVANPEFLREGTAVRDFFYPDRIVLGVSTPKAHRVMLRLYSGFGAPMVVTDPATAELTKYAANAFLALKISFINEMARLCEAVGANIHDLRHGLGTDRRIGLGHLHAGIGFGGPCLHKDLLALMRTAERYGCPSKLLADVLAVNDDQIEFLVQQLQKMIGRPLQGKVVALWGLAFKAGTSDTRNAPSLRIIRRLAGEGVRLAVYDPLVKVLPPEYEALVRHGEDPYQVARGAEALVLVTEWPEFGEVDFFRLREEMARPCVIDGRNLLLPAVMERCGFQYAGWGISGRPTAGCPEAQVLYGSVSA